MSRPPSNVDALLEASLRRMAGALQQNRNAYASIVEQIMAATGAEVAERIASKTDRVSARIAEQHQRRMDRWQRREERRRRVREGLGRDDPGSVPRGIVFTVVAITCLMLAVRQPGLFWMVFVALGFGMSAVQSFARAGRRRQVEQEGQAKDQDEAATAQPAKATTVDQAPTAPPVVDPPDPKVTRIQTLCDKLLAELESGPPIVREVVREPQTTIGGLRQACLETARRERELRSVLAAQDETGLLAERDALAARVAGERDAIVRDRLGQALRALEQQLAHRAELDHRGHAARGGEHPHPLHPREPAHAVAAGPQHGHRRAGAWRQAPRQPARSRDARSMPWPRRWSGRAARVRQRRNRRRSRHHQLRRTPRRMSRPTRAPRATRPREPNARRRPAARRPAAVVRGSRSTVEHPLLRVADRTCSRTVRPLG